MDDVRTRATIVGPPQRARGSPRPPTSPTTLSAAHHHVVSPGAVLAPPPPSAGTHINSMVDEVVYTVFSATLEVRRRGSNPFRGAIAPLLLSLTHHFPYSLASPTGAPAPRHDTFGGAKISGIILDEMRTRAPPAGGLRAPSATRASPSVASPLPAAPIRLGHRAAVCAPPRPHTDTHRHGARLLGV